MYIKDFFSKKQTVISFEIFPPKKTYSINTIYKTLDELAILNPDYISVTYGAGGSTKDTTIEISSLIKNKYNIESLAHLTCLTSTKEEINNILYSLQQNNVKNILALRGDVPKDSNSKILPSIHYNHSSDLIKHIKNYTGFCIAGACYPEGHEHYKNLNTDLYYLKQKCKYGVDFLITQLFFDNKLFFNFKNQVKQFHINIPIEVGIMPIINKQQIKHIISLCGTSIPENLACIINKYENNPEALKDAGIAYASEQIIELLSYGVPGIHIYTMNKPEIAKKIVGNISSIVKANNKNLNIS